MSCCNLPNTLFVIPLLWFLSLSQWSSGGDGSVVYRTSPAAATRAYESASSTEVEEDPDADTSWSQEVPFSFRSAVQGIATAQGPVFGSGDQFHVSAVGDNHIVATISMREGVFSSWQLYTISATRDGYGGGSSYSGSSLISAYSAFLIPFTFVISRMVQDRHGL